MLAKKSQNALNDNPEQIKLRAKSPRYCVKPTSMECGVIIENFELDKNYFEQIHYSKKMEVSKFQ